MWSIGGMILKGRTDVLSEKPVSVPFCLAQILYRLVLVKLGEKNFSLTVIVAVVTAAVTLHCKAVLYIRQLHGGFCLWSLGFSPRWCTN